MGSRQIVLVYTAGISVLDAGIFWREAKTKRLFSQCPVCRSCGTLSYSLVLVIKLTKETRRRVWRGRDKRWRDRRGRD
jgi:hypothetical protein